MMSCASAQGPGQRTYLTHHIVMLGRREGKSRDTARETRQEDCRFLRSELVRELGRGTCYAIVKACKTTPSTSPTHLLYVTLKAERDRDSLGFILALIRPSPNTSISECFDRFRQRVEYVDDDETFKREIINVQRFPSELRLINLT